MRGPRLFPFFPLEIGEDQKKGLHVHRCRVFTENIGEDQRKNSLCVRRCRLVTANIGEDEKKGLRCS